MAPHRGARRPPARDLLGRLGREDEARAALRPEAATVLDHAIDTLAALEDFSPAAPLLEAIDTVLAAQPDIVEKIRSGNLGPIGAVIGAVMKATRGQADAARVRELVVERIG